VHADYARRYRELWERHWWWRSREGWLLGWIKKLHLEAPRHRILDVGCGDGLFFETLARFGHVEGVEPDKSLVSDSRWRDRIHIGPVEAGLEAQLPYDLVLMLDVLEHIPEQSRALGAVWSVLRPGGHVLVTVPAFAWLWSRHDEANAHQRRYGPRDLRTVLKEAGFVVETLRFFFVWTVAPLYFRRLLAPAGVAAADYDVPIPHPVINRLLTAWSRCEHAIGRVVPWPLGSSMLAIARRPEVEVPAADRSLPVGEGRVRGSTGSTRQIGVAQGRWETDDSTHELVKSPSQRPSPFPLPKGEGDRRLAPLGQHSTASLCRLGKEARHAAK
jgi:SAM-dependent methyltransferase